MKMFSLPPGKLSVVLDRGFLIRLVRALCGIEHAKMGVLAVYVDVRVELSRPLVKVCAFQASHIVGVGAAIAKILGGCSVSQVAPAVIGSVRILVVNFESRPLARHPKPYHSMTEISDTIRGNAHFKPLPPACYSSRSASRRRVCGVRYLPSKDSGFRVIVKEFMTPLSRQIVARVLVAWFATWSHSILFLRSKWSGGGGEVGIASPRPHFALSDVAGQV
jgi:hypothetical protein